ncbi:BTAD domain-containing putative transcriptional regulator [Amycolatopsis sp. NPDC051061]|uniref:BTAD domain-containing putative transcriptional regulator n=1 Tax=Amycolatopsis sp. NPDC051061 TaxID=3155042 RepID=UPI00341BA334
MVRFGVLGPFVAEDDRGPLALRGPRHRAVLARLLVARGRVVPVDVLVDDLWPAPADGSAGAVQTFVSALRRALEPGRAPRTPARLLVTSGPGYALRAEDVDAWRFEAVVTTPGAAVPELDEALALWRGPAYAEFAGEAWARAEIDRLDALRLLAGERRAEAMLAAGRAAEAVPDLEAQVAAHPLREDGWRLLGLALYGAGRQGDALGALRRAREVLKTELGVDPGPGLRQAEADILAQSPRLAVPARPAVVSVALSPAETLVGRAEELALLAAEAERAERGEIRLVLVCGEAGAGKTALAETFAGRLAARGWTTAWGASPEDEGLPAGWPWTRILDTLDAPSEEGSALGLLATPSPPDRPAGIDPFTARFRLRRAVSGHLAAVAREAPVLLVFDDLHRSGAETLALLASVLAEPGAGPVLVVATYRSTDPPAALTGFLGRVARTEPARLYLGGLSPDDVREVARSTVGQDISPATAKAIHRRSGGNPFFVRELARLFDADASAEVPPGVRDVVRHRVARLDGATRDVLHRAAVAGREVDLDLLTELAGADVLDALETAIRAGFLVEPGPRRFRFAHDLVREALYEELSLSRRARWHAAVGQVLERTRPGDVEALAHHFLLAGSPAAGQYARRAAERAERRCAPHEAARLWRAALGHASDVRERLEVIMGLVRALAVVGSLPEAREHRAEAVSLAEAVGDPVLTAHVLGAFDVPAVWTANDDPELAARIVAVAERTLADLPPERRSDRGRLLATLALELRNAGGDRGRAAAREAEALARDLGDPALLAFALNARFMHAFHRAGLAPERVRIGRELVDVAATHALVTFEVLGHLVLVQAHAALADLPAADRHAEAADRLADDHDLPLVGVFTQGYRAMRAGITDDPTAEAAFRSVAARLTGTGMTGLEDGILAVTLLCHHLQRGDSLDADVRQDYGTYEPWCRAVVEPGPREVPDSPRDLLFEARTCLHVSAAPDRATSERLYADLLPAAAELAGAGSGLLTLRPVAHYLGDLAVALGRRAQAEEHYRQASKIAEACGAPHWVAAARAALG